MSYGVFTKIGNVFAGEYDYLWVPRSPRTGNYGVVLCHGAATPDNYIGAGWPNADSMAAAIANAGIPCVAGYFAGDAWCNDTVMSRIATATTYMASVTGSSTTKIHLIGISMGGGTAYRYASLNPSKVASVTGIIPLSNITYNYTSNLPTGAQASIATAWGVTYPAALPSGADLPTLASAMNGVVPSQAFYSTIDPYIRPADVQALATAAGGSAAAIDSAYGHANGTVGEMNIPALISWLKARGA